MSVSESVVSLDADAQGRLTVTLASGARFNGVEPIRTFPWSAADSPIAFVNSDGHQVAFVESLATLNPALRVMLERELSQREFIPVVQKIVSTSHRYPPCDWSIETDRGATQIHIESEEEIRRLRSNTFLITDRSGRRFQIPSAEQLDSTSRRILQRVT